MDRAQQFASETGIDKSLAKKIIDKLYAKQLDAALFDAVLWRIRNMIQEEKLPDLINATTDEEIQKIVDLLAVQVDYDNGAWCKEMPEKKVWLFSELPQAFADGTEFKVGDKVEIQIMRVGHWDHPMYGEVNITKKTLKDVKKNFDDNTRGVDIAIDENHEPDHKALGWYRELRIDGDGLFAVIELTPAGAKTLSEGHYKYFSPELVFKKVDEESGQTIENLLIGGALTNRPFFKGMQPLMATENAPVNPQEKQKDLLLFFTDPHHMNKFLEMVAKLTGQQAISAAEIGQLDTAFSEIDTPTDHEKAIVANLKKAFSEQGKKKDTTVPEGKVIVDATQFAAMESIMVRGEEAIAKLEASEITGAVAEMTFSEKNKSGAFHSNQSESLTGFLKGLDKNQRVAFSELIKAMPKLSFKEVGGGGGEAATSAKETVKKGVDALCAAEPTLSRGDATKRYFSENPKIARAYHEEMNGEKFEEQDGDE